MALIPWEDHCAEIDAAAFEQFVTEILGHVGSHLSGFCVQNQERIAGLDGAYKIDVTARFQEMGVNFLVLVECKRHARPVEREDVQVLADKIRSVGAQKGILFSTNGFQKGAIEYAKRHGIALVRVVEGTLTYETRAYDLSARRPSPPPWADIPPYVGYLTSESDVGRWLQVLVDRGHTDALAEFLIGSANPLPPNAKNRQ